MDLSNLIESQSRALSIDDLKRLIINLPTLRERVAKIPRRTYTRLADQLEFLCLFVGDEVAKLSPGIDTDSVAEAAFAMLYFQREIDLIPTQSPASVCWTTRSSSIWCSTARTTHSRLARTLASSPGRLPVSTLNNYSQLSRPCD